MFYRSTVQNFTKLNDKSLEASFEVSFLVVKDKKPAYHWETFILPATVKIAEIIYKNQYGDKLKCTPLWAHAVRRCIENVAYFWGVEVSLFPDFSDKELV